MPAFTVLVLCLVFVLPAGAADLDVFPDLDVNDPAALQEAARVLEEELKLAARPQTYLIIDLVAGAVQIKGRGVELHRLAIRSSSFTYKDRLAGVFRLTARPSVVRRKIDPTSQTEQEPISLADMPSEYRLVFTPTLYVEIDSVMEEQGVRWLRSSGVKLWARVKQWSERFVGKESDTEAPTVSLTLSVEQSRSLAWSTVDGMAVLIRRPVGR
ncbi:MAG: hypothetical protein U0412_00665 [Nitrospira sp.]